MMIDLRVRAVGLAVRAIRTFGEEPQWRQLQEECGELVAAVNHSMRRNDKSELIGELADVLFMLLQALILVPPELVFARLEQKLERFEKVLHGRPELNESLLYLRRAKLALEWFGAPKEPDEGDTLDANAEHAELLQAVGELEDWLVRYGDTPNDRSPAGVVRAAVAELTKARAR
jgi:NTP pyrophosphatase (non-canonical NTP hydrolase)